MAYLKCERCLKLWVAYGAAANVARVPDHPGMDRIRDAILADIERHETTAHRKVSAAASA